MDADDPPKFDGDPLDNPRVLVWALRVATLLLIPLGLLGSLGAFELLTGDPDNHNPTRKRGIQGKPLAYASGY